MNASSERRGSQRIYFVVSSDTGLIGVVGTIASIAAPQGHPLSPPTKNCEWDKGWERWHGGGVWGIERVVIVEGINLRVWVLPANRLLLCYVTEKCGDSRGNTQSLLPLSDSRYGYGLRPLLWLFAKIRCRSRYRGHVR